MKKATAELKVLVKARGSRLMDLHGDPSWPHALIHPGFHGG